MGAVKLPKAHSTVKELLYKLWRGLRKKPILIFGLIFAAIGLSTLLYSLASTENIRGKINNSNPISDHLIYVNSSGELAVGIEDKTRKSSDWVRYTVKLIREPGLEVASHTSESKGAGLQFKAGVESGEYTIQVSSPDKLSKRGARYEVSVTYPEAINTEDSTPPVLVINQPGTNSTVSGSFTVSGVASDDIELSSVSARIDNDTWQQATVLSDWQFNFNSLSYTDGNHTIEVKATDSSNNSTTKSLTLIFSNQDTSSGGNGNPVVADYYVSPNGNDSNNGSEAQPWRSIDYAVDKVPLTGNVVIAVSPGVYSPVTHNRDFSKLVRVIATESYKAKITGPSNPSVSFKGDNLSIEGFEIYGQPTSGDTGTGVAYFREGHKSRLVNNIIHDSYNNDLIRVLWTNDAVISGNILYNPHEDTIDVNGGSQRTLIENNIFFNDYAGSGRSVPSSAFSMVLVKYSGGTQTTGNMTIRGNVFTHYEGSKQFMTLGADGELYAEAVNVTVENNLFHMVGPKIDEAFKIVDAKDIYFKNNVFHGESSDPFAGWVGTADGSPPSENVNFTGNIFSNPKGTMKALIESQSGLVSSGSMNGNTYWNGGNSIPVRSGDILNYTSDPNAVLANPNLPINPVTLPKWNGSAFAGGYTTIEQALSGYKSLHGVKR